MLTLDLSTHEVPYRPALQTALRALEPLYFQLLSIIAFTND